MRHADEGRNGEGYCCDCAAPHGKLEERVLVEALKAAMNRLNRSDQPTILRK
jgi:hypothetical protein